MARSPSEPRPGDPLDPIGGADAGGSTTILWARRQLSPDGLRRFLATLARLAGLLRPLALLVTAAGVVAAAIVVALVRDDRPLLVLLLILCLPAIVAPLVLRRRIARLITALRHPDDAIAQIRDLAGRLADTTDLRALTARIGAKDPEGGGRIRRVVRTGRLVSAVVGRFGPDEDRHPLLVPFTPERLAGLWLYTTWSVLGVFLSGLAILLAVLDRLTDAL